MSYFLKYFDIELIKFNAKSSTLGLSIEIIEVYESHKLYFPLDLKLSNNGLLKWLK